MWIVFDAHTGIEIDSFEEGHIATAEANRLNAADDYDHYEVKWEA